MGAQLTVPGEGISPSALCGLLGDVLGAAVTSVVVDRSPYTTSFPIDNLTVTFDTGDDLHLVRKDLAWGSLEPQARSAKPPFLHDPRREMMVYAILLGKGPAGTARWYGNVDRPDLGCRWLLLERMTGVGLCEIGDVARWAASARWVAKLHCGFADQVDALCDSEVPLLVHDDAWLRRWADRALVHRRPTAQRDRAVRRVHECVDALCDRLSMLPLTLVHGEFYASNVIVSGPSAALRVAPVDWEMAALAPALTDLAALTSGDLDESMRTEIELAYCEAAGRMVDEAFAAELDLCRLAQCIQWIGWMPGWQPPAWHDHDWLREAVILMERLSL